MMTHNAEFQNKGIQAIILEPTRELAIQVAEQINKFSNLKSVLVFGGGDKKANDNSKPII
jgi:superfamily II DNA/RNA helicase